VRRQHGAAGQLGIALQLCSLRWLWFVSDDLPSAPEEVITVLAGPGCTRAGEVDYSDQARDQSTSSGSRVRGCGLVLEPIAKVSRLISAALVSLSLIGVTRSFGRFVLLLRAPLLNRS
jgi:hypothetical protein